MIVRRLHAVCGPADAARRKPAFRDRLPPCLFAPTQFTLNLVQLTTRSFAIRSTQCRPLEIAINKIVATWKIPWESVCAHMATLVHGIWFFARSSYSPKRPNSPRARKKVAGCQPERRLPPTGQREAGTQRRHNSKLPSFRGVNGQIMQQEQAGKNRREKKC